MVDAIPQSPWPNTSEPKFIWRKHNPSSSFALFSILCSRRLFLIPAQSFSLSLNISSQLILILLPPTSSFDIQQPNPSYDLWFKQDQLILSTLISFLIWICSQSHCVSRNLSKCLDYLRNDVLYHLTCLCHEHLFQPSTLNKVGLSIQDYFKELLWYSLCH